MKKSVAIVLALVIVVAAVAGFMVFANNEDDANPSSNTQTSDDSSASDNPAVQSEEPDNSDTENQPASGSVVTIKNTSFGPQKITVKRGTTVTWTNQDNVKHDVTPDVETADFKASNLLDKGDSYSVTFSETGSFTYFCSLHPSMTGSIEVVE